MEPEKIYLCNLIDVHLETAYVFMEKGSDENAVHRLRLANYQINELIKLLEEGKCEQS